jgi:hypothetical protein
VTLIDACTTLTGMAAQAFRQAALMRPAGGIHFVTSHKVGPLE